MDRVVNTVFPLTTLATASTTQTVIGAGDWRPTFNLSAARLARMEVNGLTGAMLVGVGIQLSNSRRSYNATATPIYLDNTGTGNLYADGDGIWDPYSTITSIDSTPYTLWRPC